jgi:putative PIN family toxin of toxin-antitoxin system
MQTKVFIDASVVIAAVLSDSGGSALIFKLAKKKYVDIILTERVVQEAHNSLNKKYGSESVLNLFNLLTEFKSNIKSSPKDNECLKYQELIMDEKDCHILAGADKYQTKYLLTLDKKHFFTAKLQAANLPFLILTPGDFLQELRKM